MTSIPQIAEALQHVLETEAEAAGRASGFVQRQRKVNGANFTQTLVLGWLGQPEASLEELCQAAMAVGLEITPQGLEQRFTKEASDCLNQVLQTAVAQVVQAEPVNIEILQRFNGVYIEDSSTIHLPEALAAVWSGCGGSAETSRSAVKLQVRWELSQGELEGPHLHDGRTHDRVATLAHPPLPAGSLLLRDLGYWKLDVLKEQAEQGCFWLSRAQAQVKFYDEQGRCWSQDEFVRQQQADQFELAVELGKRKRVPARLIGLRVPPQVAQARRRQLRRAAKKHGQTPSQARLALCDWSLFVTNVPADQLGVDDVWQLARVRWQIELLFKLWKSHGQLDKSRSDNPWRVLCELYAKLIAMLIQHWSFLLGNWRFPDRSLTKAAATVRSYARSLALALPDTQQLTRTLSILVNSLSQNLRINKSRKTPRTFQLLLALSHA